MFGGAPPKYRKTRRIAQVEAFNKRYNSLVNERGQVKDEDYDDYIKLLKEVESFVTAPSSYDQVEGKNRVHIKDLNVGDEVIFYGWETVSDYPTEWEDNHNSVMDYLNMLGTKVKVASIGPSEEYVDNYGYKLVAVGDDTKIIPINDDVIDLRYKNLPILTETYDARVKHVRK